MRNYRYLLRIDFFVVLIILLLMGISLCVLSSMTIDPNDVNENIFTTIVKSQLKWFVLGWGVFFLFTTIDYKKLSRLSWPLYLSMIVLLLGLFFTEPIQSVHRWYRLPIVKMNMQPSEFAKLIVVIILSSFLDKKRKEVSSSLTAWQILLIVALPFMLILKQPDLGTALVLYPIALMMSYFGGVNIKAIKLMVDIALFILTFVVLVFTDVLSHEKMRPFFTTWMKEYQYERLNPHTYHQKAAKISIALGGATGSGWHKSEFAAKKWLPAAPTDSVFAAYGEEYGFLGIVLLLILYYFLIYRSFYIVTIAKDNFAKLLASGIAVYLTMHIIVNIVMMCGFLPISGVPLALITYGGSSLLITMAALGILQSIYTRRFMF